MSWLNLRNSWLEPWIQSGSIFLSFKFILYIFFFKRRHSNLRAYGPVPKPLKWRVQKQGVSLFFFKKKYFKGVDDYFLRNKANSWHVAYQGIWRVICNIRIRPPQWCLKNHAASILPKKPNLQVVSTKKKKIY